MKFQTELGIREIKGESGDQVLAHECYQVTLASKENHRRMFEEKSSEVVEALEIIELIEGDSTKITKVWMSLDSLMKEKMIKFLKENLDIFT